MIIRENLIRLRNEKGLSQQALADAIGVRQNTIAAIESGATQRSKYLPDIARVLSVPLSDLDPDLGPNENATVAVRELLGPNDLPLHASVEAGDGGIVMSSEPIDRIQRPSQLANVKGAYGIIVSGDSMIPAVRPGDTVFIHPHIPPRQDDLCVFSYDRHGQFQATIKEYVAQTETAWRVKRYNPERLFTLKKSEWSRCHVVVGVLKRR